MTGQDPQVQLDVAVLRISGEVALSDVAGRITGAIAFAREHQLGKLLIDTRNLISIDEPTVAGSYLHVLEWARASDGHVRMALVIRTKYLDLRPFWRNAVANSGLAAEIFLDENEAMAWLESGPAAMSGRPDD